MCVYNFVNQKKAMLVAKHLNFESKLWLSDKGSKEAVVSGLLLDAIITVCRLAAKIQVEKEYCRLQNTCRVIS